MITNQGIKAPKEEVVVDIFLNGLWARSEALWEMAYNTHKWAIFILEMRKIQGFGGTGFMAKEVTLDTMFTSVWPTPPEDLNTWCPAGPGARRGLNRVFEREVKKSLTDRQALGEMRDLFSLRCDYWPKQWHFTELELHDIQFQLCEFDKYERVRLGEGRPRSLYRRS